MSDSSSTREKIKLLFDLGMNNKAISAALGVSVRTVDHHKKRLGLSKKRTVVNDALIQEMGRLIAKGMNPTDVSRRLSIAKKTVYAYFPAKKKKVPVGFIEQAMSKPVNRFLGMPWLKGDQVAAVFKGESAVSGAVER